MTSTFDPFASHPTFKYSGTTRAVYPLDRRNSKKDLPPTIVRPNYAREGVRNQLDFWWQLFAARNIKVNNQVEQEGVRKAAILAREVLTVTASHIRPGITTNELDEICFKEAVKRDCYPSPLDYHGYPKSICTSVNEIICHGIPDGTVLKDGDSINLDVTLYHHGFHGDLNATYPVGDKARSDETTMALIKTARDCLDSAISICGPGVEFAEIGKVIQPLAEERGFTVVRKYTGHGIGRFFHGAPDVYHHVTKKAWGTMKVGNIFTIEPMINASSNWKTMDWPDDWTVATVDGASSAAAEETLLVTEEGIEILTAEGGPKKIDTRENRSQKGLLKE